MRENVTFPQLRGQEVKKMYLISSQPSADQSPNSQEHQLQPLTDLSTRPDAAAHGVASQPNAVSTNFLICRQPARRAPYSERAITNISDV